MALQLDPQVPPTEDVAQCAGLFARPAKIAVLQGARNGAVLAAGERDDAGRVACEVVIRRARLAALVVEMRPADQAREIAIPLFALREQHEVALVLERQLRADDRRDARFARG